MIRQALSRAGLALALVALTACGGSPSEPSQGSVALSLEASPSTVDPTGKVDLTLVLTNSSSRAARFDFRSGCQYNFAVFRNGEPVWDLLSRVGCAAVLTSFELQPGESRTFAASWTVSASNGGPAGPGEYQARGELLTEPRRITPSATVRVAG